MRILLTVLVFVAAETNSEAVDESSSDLFDRAMNIEKRGARSFYAEMLLMLQICLQHEWSSIFRSGTVQQTRLEEGSAEGFMVCFTRKEGDGARFIDVRDVRARRLQQANGTLRTCITLPPLSACCPIVPDENATTENDHGS